MTPTLMDRITAGAAAYDEDKFQTSHRSVWDDRISTDRATRIASVENGNGVSQFFRVKRRYRDSVFGLAVSTESMGYVMARYLLGSLAARPSYSHSEPEAEANAALLSRRTGEYDFNHLIGAIATARGPLLRLIGALRAHSPFLAILGEEKGNAAFLGSYMWGVALTLAEEEVFGPLLGSSG